MQLEIIGCAGAWAHPHSAASSGYLLTWDNTRLLIDCGHGVVGEMLGRHEVREAPTDIYISHSHADHTADLVSLAYACKFGPWKDSVPNLYCHPDTYAALKDVVKAHGGEGALDHLPYTPVTDTFEIGGKEASIHLVPHLIATRALRIENFAYSADTGPEDEPLWSAGAEVILCEAAMPPNWAEPVDFHLTPAQAGKVASYAKASQLLLTHLPWLDDTWQALIEADAKTTFDGEISIVKPGQVYQINLS